LPEGHPFDPRYLCLEFSFKIDCPSNLDCKTETVCPSEISGEPEINYLAKDYATFRQLILDRLSLVMPEWTERHIPDLGITLVELLAYTGDYLSYYQDAVATEAYLQTARRRISIRRHARLVDYQIHEGCNARTWIHIETSADVTLSPDQVSFVTGLNGSFSAGQPITLEELDAVPASSYELFEPLLEKQNEYIRLYAWHNEIHFYTWGDRQCCLPRGTVSATLIDGPDKSTQEQKRTADKVQSQDDYRQQIPGEDIKGIPSSKRRLHLEAGDVLIFEEIVGPETGNPSDADPVHRHAVRLVNVEQSFDELYNQLLLEVTWTDEDALPFPLCISTMGPAPDCEMISNISVARGNVILVDHGRRVPEENLGCVPIESSETECKGPGQPSDRINRPGSYQPDLEKKPLTFSESPATGKAASNTLIQDPRRALPWIRLTSRLDPECQSDRPISHPDKGLSWESSWYPQADLLESSGEDRHFVVEMDNEGGAHLRFGDGELGRRPEAGALFNTLYRVGNGPAGNVGADSISHLVLSELLSGVTLVPRNPLPAQGGTAPESIDEVKLFAPHAFRRDQERAVTPDDYAELVMRGFGDKVQRAAAVLRWMGSWYEVLVVIDPKDQTCADDSLLAQIHGCLYRYRRIGHDVAVHLAGYVPLDIELCIGVEEGFLRGHVRAVLRDRFSNRLLPDGSLGFFHPNNLSFGQGIYMSKLVAAAQALSGVRSVRVEKFQRLFEESNNEIENGLLPLGPLEVGRLDNDPNFPENGRIGFKLRGGR
jgi:hypothetical protein